MKLSIITICYNSEAFIEKTIQSVLVQTFTDYEFIIIDGLSTDTTIDIINKYKDKIDIIVSEKDSGIYNAQNKGIQRASGEYLFFLNSGDYFFEIDTLEKIFKNSENQSIVYGDIVNNWGHSDNLWNQTGFKFRAYPELIDLEYWKNDFLCHQVVFLKKELFTKYGTFDESYKYAADHDFFYRVWFQSDVTKLHLPIIVTMYEMSGVSIQIGNREKVLSELRKSFEINFPATLKTKTSLKKILVKIFNDAKLIFLLKSYNLLKAYLLSKFRKLDFSWNVENGKKKILILNTFAEEGGAGRAAYRIFESILASNFEVKYLVAHSNISQSRIIKISKNLDFLKFLIKVFKILKTRTYFKSFKTTNPILHSASFATSYDVINTIEQMNPDIVHLNWIQFDFLTIEDMAKIKKPILWTVHDMWPISGAEHYTESERYKEGYLDTNRPSYESGFDLNQWVWNRKVKNIKGKKNFYLVGVSQWMTNCIQESILFKSNQSFVVPNGLDIRIFNPQGKFHSRNLFNISQDKKVILFGALSFHSDKRKGFQYITEAMNLLSNRLSFADIEIVVFGSDEFENENEIPFKQISLGRLTHDALLAKAYSIADVMVVPSMVESFGQTASEAMACGTPVVCFDTSGLKDIVDHKINGYRAECFSSEDLANGILWVLTDEDRRKDLSQKALEKVQQEFTLEKLSSNYSKLYEHILKDNEVSS